MTNKSENRPKTSPERLNIPIPEEIKEKAKEIQTKLNSFKEKALKEFDKYIIGITMLLPQPDKLNEIVQRRASEENRSAEEIKKEMKDVIEVLVIVDDQDSKKMSKEELHDKLFKVVDKYAQETDKNIKPIVMLLSELRESLYDGKYSILQEIALSHHLHDPTDLLAAIKIAEVHKGMVLKKFEKYIVSYVAAGSVFRGEKSHDIDVYVIVDDTDVKRMSRYELKERLRNIIITQGFEAEQVTGVKKTFHIQVYILTDFWESVKDANPVIFTFLRDGVPLYDRGVFMPWKLLLQMGRIRPSSEAIDMQMDVGEKLLDRAKKKFLGIAIEDVYYAVLNPSQAALMLYGVNPPTPRETVRLFGEIFVKKEKLIELRYVKILENLVKLYKDVDYGKLTEIKGAELDKLIADSDLFIKRVKRLFEQIEKKRENESINEIYATCFNIAKELLKEGNMKFTEETVEKNLLSYFKKNNLPDKLVGVLKDIKNAKKDYQQNKLTRAEAEKIRRDARIFVRIISDHLQRKKLFEIEKSKIRFKHGNKIGELIAFEKNLFIAEDIKDNKDKEKKIIKVSLNDNDRLGEVYDSNNQELEDALSKEKMHSKFSINEKLLEDLKKIYNEDIEILVF
ncbi:hypothetical protein HYX18_04605 [Candidatus Woesearchaeota archaeon]|nr:hypothetical protein [Candidatus Woesearchaeota archaeon]